MTEIDSARAVEINEISRFSFLNEVTAKGDSDIQRFYENAVIFITGGSGFLGKQLIEKFLRSCNIKKIYMILRPKKQKTIEDRFNKLLDDSVFDALRKIKPDFSKKIAFMAGDINEIDVGMSKEDRNIVADEVNFIFHNAATTNFMDHLKQSTLTNIRGTREVLNLAKSCKDLKAFVHVSTAYTNAIEFRINTNVDEVFYPPPVLPEIMIELAEHLEAEKLDEITSEFIKPWTNTYTFTKAIAEELVRRAAGEFPIGVMRPPIVIGAFREPIPGWLDRTCMYGLSGLIAALGLGILHLLNTDPRVSLDIVPVDFVNNATIVAGQVVSRRWERDQKDIQIYSLAGVKTKCSLEQITRILEDDVRSIITDKSVWYSYNIHITSFRLFTILFWLLHYIPGYLVVGVLILLGKNPMLVKVYEKIYKLQNTTRYYAQNMWAFTDTNLCRIYADLSPKDKLIYSFEMDDVDWKKFIVIWCIGIRKYIIRDGLNNTSYAVRKQIWLKIVNFFVMALYGYGLWKLLMFCLTVVRFGILFAASVVI